MRAREKREVFVTVNCDAPWRQSVRMLRHFMHRWVAFWSRCWNLANCWISQVISLKNRRPSNVQTCWWSNLRVLLHFKHSCHLRAFSEHHPFYRFFLSVVHAFSVTFKIPSFKKAFPQVPFTSRSTKTLKPQNSTRVCLFPLSSPFIYSEKAEGADVAGISGAFFLISID